MMYDSTVGAMEEWRFTCIVHENSNYERQLDSAVCVSGWHQGMTSVMPDRKGYYEFGCSR